MSFLLKIIFLTLVLVIIGGGAFLMLTDVNIPQETITKTIPNERVLNE